MVPVPRLGEAVAVVGVHRRRGHLKQEEDCGDVEVVVNVHVATSADRGDGGEDFVELTCGLYSGGGKWGEREG